MKTEWQVVYYWKRTSGPIIAYPTRRQARLFLGVVKDTLIDAACDFTSTEDTVTEVGGDHREWCVKKVYR